MRALLVQKRLFSPTKPLWWTGLLLSLGIGVLFQAATSQSLESEAKERFRMLARSSQFNISTGVKAYTDVLRGAASFFQSSDNITRDNFHRYVHGLDLTRNFPAIISINFAQHVPPRQGSPANRDAAVISMLEPMAGLESKFGVDIAAKPAVAESLAQSRDTGMLGATGLPIGMESKLEGPLLGMRLPVYRRQYPLGTVEERRDAYLGSVGIGFSVHRLVLEALAEIPVRHARLTLHDVSDLAPGYRPGHAGTLLFDSTTHELPKLPEAAMIACTLPIDFNGRRWEAHFTAPRTSLFSQFDAFLPWLALLTGFTGSMLIYALFHSLTSSPLQALRMAKSMTRELRESQAKLQLSHHKLRRLAAHAEQIKEEERKRIAREIHDDLGQNLLALRIEADVLATRTRQRHPRLHQRAHFTLVQIDYIIKSVRQIINDLRPTVMDLGLGAAVEWQIAQFRQRSGIVCELSEHGEDIDSGIDDKCAIAFFRVLQESLSNILQHAHASLVRVELRHQDGMLSMTISDNGVGLHPHSRNKFGSFGLVGIEERISILGGECSISGAPNVGTVVQVAVSFKRQSRQFSSQLAKATATV